jgi:hypothetical protein
VCTAGQWQNDGACADPDVCMNGSGQNIACGLNGAGLQAQMCTGGAWQNDGACIDPDVCTNGARQTIDCGVGGEGSQAQDCVGGQWQDDGVCAPVGWSCDSSYFDALDGCDCECGAYDPDCDVAGQTVYGCDTGEICNVQGDCQASTVPGAWTCSDDYYGDGWCDCGCGAVDVDCADATYPACDYCDSSQGSCSPSDCSAIDPVNNAVCSSVAGWNCSRAFYGDGECDCGCGIVDVDCANNTSAVCQYCTPSDGSCSLSDCSEIDPSNNAVCD